MYNFENEIKQINNKQLDDFFGNDYFHDGFILSIESINENTVKMRFACEREWTNEQANTGDWFDHILNEDYHYNVYFKNCIYLNLEINDFPIEYINGRFKNSTKLKFSNKESGKSNYHLRMQIASGGFIDIIFSDFSIEKLKGDIQTFEDNILNHFNHISNRFDSSLDISEIRKISIDEDNFKRDWAIVHLFNLNDSFAQEAAIKALDSEEDDVKIASIFVLGHIAGVEIIPKLFTLWTNTDYPIMKRHILDSVEKIIERKN
jgi:hypothetical protein